MGNNTRIATLLNGAISLLAVVAITLVCIVPTAFAEDGANTSDAPGAGADNSVEQIAGPVPNIIITNFTYGDGSVAVGSSFNRFHLPKHGQSGGEQHGGHRGRR